MTGAGAATICFLTMAAEIPTRCRFPEGRRCDRSRRGCFDFVVGADGESSGSAGESWGAGLLCDCVREFVRVLEAMEKGT
jgi:hypothetical protein